MYNKQLVIHILKKGYFLNITNKNLQIKGKKEEEKVWYELEIIAVVSVLMKDLKK